MTTIDTTKKEFDWDDIPAEIRKLSAHMKNAIDSISTDEDWEAFEGTEITVGFGDFRIVLPTCAASFNEMTYFLDSMANEFEE